MNLVRDMAKPARTNGLKPASELVDSALDLIGWEVRQKREKRWNGKNKTTGAKNVEATHCFSPEQNT